MHHIKAVAVIVVIMLAASSAGCLQHTEPAQKPTDIPETEPAPAQAEVGGRMTFGTTESLRDANPLLVSDVHTHFLSHQVYAGLVRADEDLKMQPYVAEHWEFSDDGRKWTFYLRDDVYFHDGEQLTADDVAFTYSLLQHEDYPGVLGPQYDVIEEVSVEDELTVTFHLTHAHAPLLSHLQLGILPEHLFAQYPVAQLQESASKHPVGAGPYRQASRDEDQILLEKNPDFFLPGPFIEELIIRCFDDEQSMIAALQEKEIDYMGNIPIENIAELKGETEHLDFHERQHNGYMYLGLNQTDPVLSDNRVRQAIMYGIDRSALVDEVLEGQASVQDSHIPAFSWAHHDNVVQYEYDPEKAQQLLSEAGWTEVNEDGVRVDADGQQLIISCVTAAGSTEREQVLAHIKSDLGQIGVDVQKEIVGWDELLGQHVETGDFQAYLLGWALEVDPDPYLYFHSEASFDEDGLLVGFNDIGFSHERVDQLIEAGRTTLCYDARAEIYAELQKILSEQLPYIFLYSQTLTTAVNSDVSGAVIGDTGPLYIERWYIKSSDVD